MPSSSSSFRRSSASIEPLLATDLVREDHDASRRPAIVDGEPAEQARDRDRLRRVGDRQGTRWYALLDALMRSALHAGNHLAPRSSFSRSTKWSFGRLLRRRRTLTWWRSTAFSRPARVGAGLCPRRRLRSRSPACAAPTATTTAPWEPEPTSGFQRHSARASATWSTSAVAGRATCAHQLPPGSCWDAYGSQHGPRWHPPAG